MRVPATPRAPTAWTLTAQHPQRGHPQHGTHSAGAHSAGAWQDGTSASRAASGVSSAWPKPEAQTGDRWPASPLRVEREDTQRRFPECSRAGGPGKTRPPNPSRFPCSATADSGRVPGKVTPDAERTHVGAGLPPACRQGRARAGPGAAWPPDTSLRAGFLTTSPGRVLSTRDFPRRHLSRPGG